jgi:hypothetical protein
LCLYRQLPSSRGLGASTTERSFFRSMFYG